jgi:predicted enzyme involved in methoxymalonyl-ACP biosynthesis
MLQRCRALGYQRILGEYIPTKKNTLVATFYSTLGFRQTDAGDGPSVFYELVMDGATPPETFIRDDSPTEYDSDMDSSGARSGDAR